MGLFSRKPNKKKMKKEFDALNNRYLDFIDEHDCQTCKCYNSGNVETFAMRFEKCHDCEWHEAIHELTRKMDGLVLEMDKL